MARLPGEGPLLYDQQIQPGDDAVHGMHCSCEPPRALIEAPFDQALCGALYGIEHGCDGVGHAKYGAGKAVGGGAQSAPALGALHKVCQHTEEELQELEGVRPEGEVAEEPAKAGAPGQCAGCGGGVPHPHTRVHEEGKRVEHESDIVALDESAKILGRR